MTEKLEEILSAHQGNPIAIYGLGPLTEKLLAEIGERCPVIGLLDSCRAEGMLYGKPILSIESALARGTRLIVVVARPESVRVIAKRVWNICGKYRARLVDLDGNDVNAAKRPVYSFRGGGVTKEQVSRLINAHDFVSSDLFDTLIMRRTLLPTDVFEITDCRLREQGIAIEGFREKRMESEKELACDTVPALEEIYRHMVDQYAISGVEPEKLAELEWAVDCELVVPRRQLCELLHEKSRQGKPVYIVSDTFYTKKGLTGLLEKCGITWYAGILTSCEYRTGKTQGLFHVLKGLELGKTGVHIGDSLEADVGSAEKNGLTGCQLYSGEELFQRTGCLDLWNQIDCLRDRIQAGMLISRLFNTPFQFETSETRISVRDAADIGYLFFPRSSATLSFGSTGRCRRRAYGTSGSAPVTAFCSKSCIASLEGAEPSAYVLASRIAAICAGMRDESDIEYVQSMRFNGSLREQMKERFGISVDFPDGEEPPEGLMAYKRKILSAAEENRRHYQTYLQTIDVREGGAV